MKNAARLFTCALCRRQVVLCRRCDKGHLYCSPRCSVRARRRSVRLAGRRYQNSRRHKHAERRYRERRRVRDAVIPARAQKVTHHPLTVARRRSVVARMPGSGTRPFGPDRPARVFRCERCGRFCGGLSGPAREGSEMAIDKQTRAEIQRLYFAEKWRIGTIARQRPPRHGRARGSGGRGAHASEAAQGFDDRSVVHPPDLGGLAALQPALPDGGRARLPGKREPLPAHDRARAPAARGLSAPQGPASRLRWTGLTSAR